MSKLLTAGLVVASLVAWQIGPGASRVAPLVDLTSPERSPFPSDRFTVADARQLTGRRVNLPMPGDCAVQASECEDLVVLNQFDGFNVQARISIPFTGAIDPSTVSSRSVFLVRLDASGAATPSVTGINHIVWDPEVFEVSARPDRALDEHTRYALVVTTAVHDAEGRPIDAGAIRGADPVYQRDLRSAEAIARRALGGERGGAVAAVSVFTTQSVSHVITGIRDVMEKTPPPKLDFGVGPGGERAVFKASEIETITTNWQRSVTGPLTQSPMPAVQIMRAANAVGTVAFGVFRAIDFTVRPSGHVPIVPTRTGRLTPNGSIDVAFNLWLPSGARPAQGWPVAIYSHGSFAAKNVAFTSAGVLASHGIAVIAINAMGHGGGARTTMTVGLAGGRSITVAAPGLGYDADGDGEIATWEPQRASAPQRLLGANGTLVEATAEYLQLVRALQGGVDVDGDGAVDLDASRIYCYSLSLGSSFAMMAFAVEPAIRAAVFGVPAGTRIYNTMLSPSLRQEFGQVLGARSPSLLNSSQGLAVVDGAEMPEPRFNESLPLRDQPPLVNRVPGARAIQRVADHAAWATQIGSTVPIAPLLRRMPLPGVPARPFIVQMARSDSSSTNPGTSDMIRAGDFADRVALYRHDLNFGNPGVPVNPHTFVSSLAAPPAYARVGLGAQHQIGTFFESDGKTAMPPTPAELWEMPIRTLPNDPFLMPRPR